MNRARRTAIVVAVGLAVTGSSAAFGVSQHTISGGTTTITLNAASEHALRTGGFSLKAVAGASLHGKRLVLPVSGGSYDSGIGTVDQRGGFTITNGARHVTIKNIRTTTTALAGTADVSGHGRIDAVVVGFPTSLAQSGSSAHFAGYTVTLAKPLITVLDKKFATKRFARHAEIGVGATSLTFSN